MLRLQAWLGGKRGFAVAVMTLALLLLLIVPFTLAIVTLLDNADMIKGWVESLKAKGLPPPPGWVSGIPLAGPKLSESWRELASAGPEGLSAQLVPYAGKIVTWFVDQAGSVGMMIVQFLLTVIISAILYSGGEPAADAVRRFVRRLAGQQGDDVTVLAARAIRGVAFGVGVTALDPVRPGRHRPCRGRHACRDGADGIMFILCIAQLGPALILFPAVAWLFWSDQTLWGSVLLVWSLVVVTLDNFLRPILIKKGADLPLLLIFAGVIGGLVAFGIIGLFIGPVVLAVTYIPARGLGERRRRGEMKKPACVEFLDARQVLDGADGTAPQILCGVLLPTLLKTVFRQEVLHVPEGAVFANAPLLLLRQPRPEDPLGENEIGLPGGAQIGIPVADVDDLPVARLTGLEDVALAGPALVAGLIGVGKFDGQGLPVLERSSRWNRRGCRRARVS